MTTEATHKLYVNLSASQARKRVKGHGLGVRRVEAADRNQAVVFHTATGAHREALEALFADVATSSQPELLDTPVENLRNLGPRSAAWLHEIGVHTPADLRRLGPALAYQLIRQRQPSANLNLLWALAAALTDRDWRELSADEKDRLRTAVAEE